MFQFNSPKNRPHVQREPLFSLDGVVGTIPVKFTATDAMAYMNAVRNYGPETAVSWALEYALNDPRNEQPGAAYAALLDAPDGAIPDDEMERMCAIIVDRIMGRKAGIPGGKSEALPEDEAAGESDTESSETPERMSGA